MKIQANLLLAIVAALSLSTSRAHAGTSSGGGNGTGLLKANGQMELLDLAENDTNFESDFQKFDPRDEAAYKNVIAPRLARVGEVLPVMKGEAEDSFNKVVGSTNFYFTDKDLPSTGDTCLLTKENTVQAAIQRNGKVVVSRKWYEAADEENRGALLAHEIVMQQLGQQGYCTNQVRETVRALMNPESLAPKKLGEVFFQNAFGKHVPKVAYEPNNKPFVENRSVSYDRETYTYNWALHGEEAIRSETALGHLCFTNAQAQISAAASDPEIVRAIDKIRFDKKVDYVDLSFYARVGESSAETGLALNLHSGSGPDDHVRGFHNVDDDYSLKLLTLKNDGSVKGGSYGTDQIQYRNLLGKNGCNVTKEQLLSLINGYLKNDSAPKPPVTPDDAQKPATPSELHACVDELIKLDRAADDMRNSMQQIPADWLNELSIKLSGPSTVHFWNTWTQSGCDAKRAALKDYLQRMANVKSTVEKKHGIPVSPANDTSSKEGTVEDAR